MAPRRRQQPLHAPPVQHVLQAAEVTSRPMNGPEYVRRKVVAAIAPRRRQVPLHVLPFQYVLKLKMQKAVF